MMNNVPLFQVNDLTELHQNEMETLKTAMTDMEEKVNYQSEERLRDVHEILENCNTRVSAFLWFLIHYNTTSRVKRG